MANTVRDRLFSSATFVASFGSLLPKYKPARADVDSKLVMRSSSKGTCGIIRVILSPFALNKAQSKAAETLTDLETLGKNVSS